jgi:hypothetical protein
MSLLLGDATTPKIQLVNVVAALQPMRTKGIIDGASGGVHGIVDEDPKWMASVIPVSSAVRKTGSQNPRRS